MTWMPEGVRETTCKVCEREEWTRVETKVFVSMRKTDCQAECGYTEGGGVTRFGMKWRKGNKLNLQGKTL